MRAFADGFVSLLLPFYLTLLGYNALEVGVIVTATLVGSGLTTLGMGFVAHRYGSQRLLLAGAGLMCLTPRNCAGAGAGFLAAAHRGLRGHAQPECK